MNWEEDEDEGEVVTKSLVQHVSNPIPKNIPCSECPSITSQLSEQDLEKIY